MTTTAPTTQAPFKKIEEQRFEFILYINNKHIIQRYFNIRDYDEDSRSSRDIKELMDNLIGMNNGNFGTLGIIPNRLKEKSVDYLWENFNTYAVQTQEDIKVNTDKDDNFQFEIKVDKVTLAKGQFPGSVFPPKVRYQVDVRDITPTIIAEIRDFLSKKN